MAEHLAEAEALLDDSDGSDWDPSKVKDRREMVTLLAADADAFDTLREGLGLEVALAATLHVICLELVALGVRQSEMDDELLTVSNGGKVIGAMVGGLFGITLAEDADETMLTLNQRGRELRARIL